MSDLPAHRITERKGISEDGRECIIRKYERFEILSWTLQFQDHAELADWIRGIFVGRDTGIKVRVVP